MAVCDVCDSTIRAADGLVLTTTEVAENPQYWKHVFTHSWSYVHEMDPAGTMLAALAERQAAQDSGWLVCSSCAQLFAFDTEQAVERAQESLRNPQKIYGKAASPAAVLKAARIAWVELFGRASVDKPTSKAPVAGIPAVRVIPSESISIKDLEKPAPSLEPRARSPLAVPPVTAPSSAEVPLSAFGVALKEKASPKKPRTIRFIIMTFGIVLAIIFGAFLQYRALDGNGHALLESTVGFFAQFTSVWIDRLWPWIRGLFIR